MNQRYEQLRQQDSNRVKDKESGCISQGKTTQNNVHTFEHHERAAVLPNQRSTFLKKLRPVESSKNRELNKSKFCMHYQDYGHTIEASGNFNYRIELELQKGNLTQYVKRKAHTVNTINALIGYIHVIFSEVEEISKIERNRNHRIK